MAWVNFLNNNKKSLLKPSEVLCSTTHGSLLGHFSFHINIIQECVPLVIMQNGSIMLKAEIRHHLLGGI